MSLERSRKTQSVSEGAEREMGPPTQLVAVGKAEALRTSMSLERSRKTQSVSEGAEREP